MKYLMILAVLLAGSQMSYASGSKVPPKPTPGEVKDIHMADSASETGDAKTDAANDAKNDAPTKAGVDVSAKRGQVATESAKKPSAKH